MQRAESAGLGTVTQLWSAMPRALGAQFRPLARELSRAMLREILREVPGYAELSDSTFRQTVATSIEQAILCALDDVGEQVPRNRGLRLFRQLGELEYRQGREIDCLLGAYRVGGRVAWRYIAARGQACGASTTLLCHFAEALFAYVDVVSALSVDGYAAARARDADSVTSRRRRLLATIVADPPPAPRVVAELAEAARWPVPERVAAVAIDRQAGEPDGIAQLAAGTLADLEAEEPYLLTADPVGDLAVLEREPARWRVTVGPMVRIEEAAGSLRCARRLLDLVRRGVLRERTVTRCDEHLATLCFLGDQFVLRELRARSLAPLDGLTSSQRARLSETLLAWLRLRGSAPELAAQLAVHPQTVRYRMRQLHALFGDRLDDADERLNLEIALSTQRLLPTAG